MPELPDLEVMKRYLESTVYRQPIASVSVLDGGILKDISPQALGRKLHGESFTDTCRYGKYLFLEISGGAGWLLMHFGMTGGLKYYRKTASAPEDQALKITFENGFHLSYISVRKLGEVELIPDVSRFISRKDLGPDVMQESFTTQRFLELMRNRRGMIKTALMDQHLLAGIGNVYSDEILFQAGIHPRSQVSALAEKDLRRIYRKMKDVLRMAIDCQADPDNFPDDYLTPLRGNPGVECPGCSGSIQRTEVAGRGSYFCPECQVKKG